MRLTIKQNMCKPCFNKAFVDLYIIHFCFISPYINQEVEKLQAREDL